MAKFKLNPQLTLTYLPGIGKMDGARVVEGEQFRKFVPAFLVEIPEPVAVKAPQVVKFQKPVVEKVVSVEAALVKALTPKVEAIEVKPPEPVKVLEPKAQIEMALITEKLPVTDTAPLLDSQKTETAPVITEPAPAPEPLAEVAPLKETTPPVLTEASYSDRPPTATKGRRRK